MPTKKADLLDRPHVREAVRTEQIALMSTVEKTAMARRGLLLCHPADRRRQVPAWWTLTDAGQELQRQLQAEHAAALVKQRAARGTSTVPRWAVEDVVARWLARRAAVGGPDRDEAIEALQAALLGHRRMVWIPAGRFVMGSPASDTEACDDECPVHEVILPRPFLLSAAPVTQGQWRELMGNAPARFQGDDHPVEQVSWWDAVAYCNALSRREGLEPAYALSQEQGTPGAGDYQAVVQWKGLASAGYRLPTEAEWEYACRAGSTAPRYGELDRIAWYDQNSDMTTHPVGQQQPSGWGLHDMLGNVWEWCWDWYGAYVAGSATDPTGPATGSLRVNRGGSWCSSSRFVRAAYRLADSPGSRDDAIGFRPARSWGNETEMGHG